MIEPGQKFGEWTVIRRVPNEHNQCKFLCTCSCGNTCIVAQTHLLHGNSTKCIKCVGSRSSLNAAIRNQNKYSNNRRTLWLVNKVHALYKKQNGICSICMKSLGSNSSSWCLDHNHLTGNTRELLHRSCNVFLGKVERDLDLPKRMLEYLERHKTN